MLFLAVTLGFFMENQREHFVEKRREKNFIKSLIEDLKRDTAVFQATYLNNDSCLKKMDSLIILFKSPDRNSHTSQLYYLARMVYGVTRAYLSTDRTFSQMKNSGNLRLIDKNKVTDSITNYYYTKTEILQVQYNAWTAHMEEYFKKASIVFDASIFQQMHHERIKNNSLDLPVPPGNPPLATENKETITAFIGAVHFLYTRTKGMGLNALSARNAAINLINLLRDQYHLKDE